MRSKIKADYSLKRLKNLTPVDFVQEAKPKVSTGREAKQSKEEKFKVLLRKQIDQLKSGKIQTSQFTQSLTKTHDSEFKERILPAIKWYQEKYNPKGASQNRDPVLLSNSFNIEVYKACITQQKQSDIEKRHKKR